MRETNRQLSDKTNHEILQKTPLFNTIKLNDTLDRCKSENLLPKKTAEGMNVINPKFYIAPKIGKENNRGRPVINSINCHTSRSFTLCWLSPSTSSKRNSIIQ